MSFRVSTRRTSALPLLLLGGVAELAEIAQLAPQMLARIGVLVFAQQAVMQQLGDRWRLRNPFRQRGTSSRQVDSQPLGDYIKTPIGNSRASRQAHKLAGQALALERELKMEEAAELFVQAAQLEPSSPEYWARASKVVSDSSYLPGTTPQKAAELNKRALELGIKAIEANPQDAFGHVACCVSRGRLAVVSDNRSKARLARLAQEDVRRALELEPGNDVAHHLLGRWHYEMASVNAVVRTIIHMLYGTALMAGNYREAAASFERASALRPDMLIHRVELARSCLKLGQQQRAREELQLAVGLDLPDLNAVLLKEDAKQMLEKLLGSNGGSSIESSSSSSSSSGSSSS